MTPNIDPGGGFRDASGLCAPIVKPIARATFLRREQAQKASHARDLHGGGNGMRNLPDMLALDVRPLAKQDLGVRRCEIGWPK